MLELHVIKINLIESVGGQKKERNDGGKGKKGKKVEEIHPEIPVDCEPPG